MNEDHGMLRISRVTWLTQIFVYLSLDDCLMLGQTCLYFNQMIKSPLFIKMQVKMREKTKIDISMNAFSQNRGQLSTSSISLFRSQISNAQQFSSQLEEEKSNAKSGSGKKKGKDLQANARVEDKEAELETLRNVKIFLTDKLKQNEEITCTFQQDINILKDVLRVEKQINQKTQAQLKQKDVDIKDLRQEFLETDKNLREQINRLSITEQEQTLHIQTL